MYNEDKKLSNGCIHSFNNYCLFLHHFIYCEKNCLKSIMYHFKNVEFPLEL